ncbi:arginine N-succinyltransferase [bacterium]|nr:arginine N-succinyltransferase [bacterium]
MPETEKKRGGCLRTLGIVLVAVLLSVAASVWAVKTFVFPSNFKPVELSADEEKELAAKLGFLEPETYSEAPEDRSIRFSERELNAMIARNTDLAERVAIDLSKNMISAKVLIPMDEDVPVVGGKTLRVKAGLEMSLVAGTPKVVLKGVTVMGLPLPKAWLGGIKNIDLMQEFSGEGGFWQTLFNGLEELSVEDGEMKLRVKE